MAVSQALRVPRITLAAGALTPVQPPATFRSVSLGNATGGNLTVYTNDDLAANEYFLIADGFERTIKLEQRLFHPGETAFWLLSVGGGVVVPVWH